MRSVHDLLNFRQDLERPMIISHTSLDFILVGVIELTTSSEQGRNVYKYMSTEITVTVLGIARDCFWF